MMSVKEVCNLTGVSARTLRYYDSIGLLRPAFVSDAGYRFYNEKNIEVLHDILLFRELEFSLNEIKEIISSTDFDRQKALNQQIELLKLKKERLESLISYAENLSKNRGENMNFNEFSKEKLKEYSETAKKEWGHTDAYKEYEKRKYSENEENSLSEKLMNYFVEFGKLKGKNPNDDEIQSKVRELQKFITDNYYTCTNQILASLGQMYCAGGEMTENIDKAGGKGTAEFAAKAIKEYCK